MRLARTDTIRNYHETTIGIYRIAIGTDAGNLWQYSDISFFITGKTGVGKEGIVRLGAFSFKNLLYGCIYLVLCRSELGSRYCGKAV